MNILITGKNGFIGSHLTKKLVGYNIEGIERNDFDLTNREETNKFFQNKYYDIIIHTAIVGGSRLREDDGEVFYQNLSMFYNLLANQDKFGQLISFGSGAELGKPSDPYGLSKNIINRIIESEDKFNNIRIFAVFNEEELDTRFIKGNIKRYINKEPLIIHQDKLMDFFYMDDLVYLVDHVIKNPDIKTVDCSYLSSYPLSTIARMINELSDHKCEIIVQNEQLGKPYISQQDRLKLPYIGLKQAIKNVYNELN